MNKYNLTNHVTDFNDETPMTDPSQAKDGRTEIRQESISEQRNGRQIIDGINTTMYSNKETMGLTSDDKSRTAPHKRPGSTCKQVALTNTTPRTNTNDNSLIMNSNKRTMGQTIAADSAPAPQTQPGSTSTGMAQTYSIPKILGIKPRKHSGVSNKTKSYSVRKLGNNDIDCSKKFNDVTHTEFRTPEGLDKYETARKIKLAKTKDLFDEHSIETVKVSVPAQKKPMKKPITIQVLEVNFAPIVKKNKKELQMERAQIAAQSVAEMDERDALRKDLIKKQKAERRREMLKKAANEIPLGEHQSNADDSGLTEEQKEMERRFARGERWVEYDPTITTCDFDLIFSYYLCTKRVDQDQLTAFLNFLVWMMDNVPPTNEANRQLLEWVHYEHAHGTNGYIYTDYVPRSAYETGHMKVSFPEPEPKAPIELVLNCAEPMEVDDATLQCEAFDGESTLYCEETPILPVIVAETAFNHAVEAYAVTEEFATEVFDATFAVPLLQEEIMNTSVDICIPSDDDLGIPDSNEIKEAAKLYKPIVVKTRTLDVDGETIDCSVLDATNTLLAIEKLPQIPEEEFVEYVALIEDLRSIKRVLRLNAEDAADFMIPRLTDLSFAIYESGVLAYSHNGTDRLFAKFVCRFIRGKAHIYYNNNYDEVLDTAIQLPTRVSYDQIVRGRKVGPCTRDSIEAILIDSEQEQFRPVLYSMWPELVKQNQELNDEEDSNGVTVDTVGALIEFLANLQIMVSAVYGSGPSARHVFLSDGQIRYTRSLEHLSGYFIHCMYNHAMAMKTGLERIRTVTIPQGATLLRQAKETMIVFCREGQMMLNSTCLREAVNSILQHAGRQEQCNAYYAEHLTQLDTPYSSISMFFKMKAYLEGIGIKVNGIHRTSGVNLDWYFGIFPIPNFYPTGYTLHVQNNHCYAVYRPGKSTLNKVVRCAFIGMMFLPLLITMTANNEYRLTLNDENKTSPPPALGSTNMLVGAHQMNNDSDEESAVTVQGTTTQFTDANNTRYEENQVTENDIVTLDHIHSIQTILARPSLLKEVTLDAASPSLVVFDLQTPIASIKVPLDIINSGNKSSKIANFAYFRSTAVVKVMVNANPFTCGKLWVCMAPVDSRLLGSARIANKSRPAVTSYPGVELDLQVNKSVELQVPWTYPEECLNPWSPFIGSTLVNVYAMSPLQGPGGFKINMQVFGWLKDVVLRGPTVELIGEHQMANDTSIPNLMRTLAESTKVLSDVIQMSLDGHNATELMLKQTVNATVRSYNAAVTLAKSITTYAVDAEHLTTMYANLTMTQKVMSDVVELALNGRFATELMLNQTQSAFNRTLNSLKTLRESVPKSALNCVDGGAAVLNRTAVANPRITEPALNRVVGNTTSLNWAGAPLGEHQSDVDDNDESTGMMKSLARVAKKQKKITTTDKKDVPQVEREAKGPIGRIAGTVSKIANIAGNIPYVSTVAKPVQWVADIVGSVVNIFGWSRPVEGSAAPALSNIPGRGMAQTVCQDQAVVLGYSNLNELNTQDNFFLRKEDEMETEFIAGRPGLIDVIPYDTSSAGTLAVQLAGSQTDPQRVRKTVVAQTTYEFAMTCYEYLAHMTSHWRADLHFRISAAKTAFHTGRLEIVYVPGKRQTNPNFDATNCYRAIFDLSRQNEIEFVVPFVSLYEMAEVTMNEDEGANGCIYIRALTPLLCPETVSQTIDIFVWKWASNVALAGTAQSTPGFIPAGEHQMDLGIDTHTDKFTCYGNTTSPSTNLAVAQRVCGEILTNARLLTRAHRNLGLSPSETVLLSEVAVGNDYLSYLGSMYSYFRGGLSYKILSLDPSGSVSSNLLRSVASDPFPSKSTFHITYPALNPVHEIMVPYYARTRKVINNENLTTQESVSRLPAVAVNAFGGVAVYRAAKDDFSMGCLIGPQTLKYAYNSVTPGQPWTYDTIPLSYQEQTWAIWQVWWETGHPSAPNPDKANDKDAMTLEANAFLLATYGTPGSPLDPLETEDGYNAKWLTWLETHT